MISALLLKTTSIEETKDNVENITKEVQKGTFQKWLDGMLPEFISFFWCVVLSIVVWVVGTKILKFIRKIIQKAMTRRDVDKGVRQFTDGLVKVAGYLVLVVVIFNVFGIETSSFAAAIASLGVTVGLALQGSLSNFAGGVLILLLHPFRVGDYIIEDSHKNEGTVVEISLFYTKLLTLDKKLIVVPNGALANTSLTNVTGVDTRQLDLEFSIGYDDDIKKAKDVLLKVAQKEERRLDSEPIKVFVKELGDSAVILGLRMMIPNEQYWDIRWSLIEAEKIALDEAGISIPYPQLDVHNV
ncbi:MAG: mechanosensitive ion channel family protein [Lachnospiraceae bacterium]|nr:mechanosensitive ion channel family protein [Lachnospiraceae bacterium]